MKKQNYYVLVFTSSGPKYVTSYTSNGHMCYWDELEKPLTMSKEVAEDIVFGLTLNYFNAVLVNSKYEIDSQPYLYNKGGFKWEYKKEES